jgi:hypothetical protein
VIGGPRGKDLSGFADIYGALCIPHIGQSGASSLVECVRTHFDGFGEPCKAALARIAVVREACGADIQEHCHGLKPGAGRILLCVKQHFTTMSEPCKEAIGRAAERKAAVH